MRRSPLVVAYSLKEILSKTFLNMLSLSTSYSKSEKCKKEEGSIGSGGGQAQRPPVLTALWGTTLGAPAVTSSVQPRWGQRGRQHSSSGSEREEEQTSGTGCRAGKATTTEEAAVRKMGPHRSPAEHPLLLLCLSVNLKVNSIIET